MAVFDSYFQFSWRTADIYPEFWVATVRSSQAAPRKFSTPSLDRCYKIFGVRWSTRSTLFQVPGQPGPAVFRYFSTLSTPSPVPFPGSSARVDEDEVAFDLWEPSYTGNSTLSALSSCWALGGWGSGRTGWMRERNPESSLPAIKDRSSNVESHPIGHRGSRRHP